MCAIIANGKIGFNMHCYTPKQKTGEKRYKKSAVCILKRVLRIPTVLLKNIREVQYANYRY